MTPQTVYISAFHFLLVLCFYFCSEVSMFVIWLHYQIFSIFTASHWTCVTLPAHRHLSHLQQSESVDYHCQGFKSQLHHTHKHSSSLFGHIQPYFLLNAIIRISMSGYITGLSDLFGVVVHHAGGVVHGQTDLVLPLAGLGPPQPDLVFPELTGDVGDHLPHVQTLPCAVITSVEHHTLATYRYQQNAWYSECVSADLSLAACVGSRMSRSCSHSCWERAEVRLWYWCHMEAAVLSWNTSVKSYNLDFTQSERHSKTLDMVQVMKTTIWNI